LKEFADSEWLSQLKKLELMEAGQSRGKLDRVSPLSPKPELQESRGCPRPALGGVDWLLCNFLPSSQWKESSPACPRQRFLMFNLLLKEEPGLLARETHFSLSLGRRSLVSFFTGLLLKGPAIQPTD